VRTLFGKGREGWLSIGSNQEAMREHDECDKGNNLKAQPTVGQSTRQAARITHLPYHSDARRPKRI